MCGLDQRVTGLVGTVLGLDHDVAGPLGEPAESGVGVQGFGVVGSSGDEAFLRRLFGDTHALADLCPRGAGSTGLVDEVADEVVGHLAKCLGGQHGVGELIEGLVVHLGDDVDQVVETDGVGDLRAHVVNPRLTLGERQPWVDDCASG